MIIKTGEIVCVVKKADYNNNYASNMKAYGGVEFFTMQNYKTNTDTNGYIYESTGLYLYAIIEQECSLLSYKYRWLFF